MKYLADSDVRVPSGKTKNSPQSLEVVKGVLLAVGLFAIILFIAPTILG